MIEFAALVNVEDLASTVVAAFVSAMAVAIVASLGIWGSTKYVDFSQDGRTVSAAFALCVGILGLITTLGIIALGLFLMVAK